MKVLPGLKSEHQEGSHHAGARHIRTSRALGWPASGQVRVYSYSRILGDSDIFLINRLLHLLLPGGVRGWLS